MSRVLIVSNRLPVTVKTTPDGVEVIASSGGLATGLRGFHESSGALWIGWPGDTSTMDAAQREALRERLASAGTVPVDLDPDEAQRFYASFSNGVLWPLFHYQLDRIPSDACDWDAYRSANEKFAAAVAERYEPGDTVWVHDYQLMLVPSLLRERLPEARIGFFLHIPFPSSDVFRTLPWRRSVLEGLLGADLVGFHAYSYARHFSTSLLRVLGLEPHDHGVFVDGRDVRFGVFPMGVDAAGFQALSADPDVRSEAEAIRSEARDQRILLGIDRLDYTKGLPRRLLAFERLLARSSELRGRVRLVQLAVPSRSDVGAYAQIRAEVDEIVGRVNGRFGTAVSTPIHYLYRSLTPRHVVALYRAADVMLVTPLRDGMNLVAKEFVASRDDEDGVLVLSEFAGAASEMGDALLVNPFDVDGVADALSAAMTMSRGERTARMRRLRKRVLAHDVHVWADSFLAELDRATRASTPAPRPIDGLARLTMRLVAAAHEAPECLVLLDYDGTLVAPTSTPDLAVPDPELLELLRALASRRATRVHLVSGRTRESLEGWFGAIPMTLHAEHGFWSRSAPDQPWTAQGNLDPELKGRVGPILEEFAARTPGAFVEEKTSSLAWHYRLADPEFGFVQARELRVHLANAFANAPIEVLLGDKVVEVRSQGIHKGMVAASLTIPERACIVAMGNDATDEDMFRALPSTAFTVHVGRGATHARFRLASPMQARAALQSLLP